MSAERVPASMQRRVRERAAERCEYGGIAQAQQEATGWETHPSTFQSITVLRHDILVSGHGVRCFEVDRRF